MFQIIDHAATIKQLQTADAAIAKLEDKVNESLQAKLEAEAKQVILFYCSNPLDIS